MSNTFRLDRMVEVLAHIRLSETRRVNEPLPAGFVGHTQETWGEITVPKDQIVNLGFALDDDADDQEWTAPGGVLLDDSCGTAGCAAGWALQLSGVEQRWEEMSRNGRIWLELRGAADGSDTQRFAADWLGIPLDRRGHWSSAYGPGLFAPGNTYEDLVGITADYAEVEIHTVNEMVAAKVDEVQASRQVARENHLRLWSSLADSGEVAV